MNSKQTIPKQYFQKKVKILNMDQQSVVAPRFYCSSEMRPYEGYMTSSNGTFEFARIERPFTYCLPEINVYKTQFKYQEINDHFQEVFIGKVVQKITIIGRTFDVYYATGRDLELKYKIKGKFTDRIKEISCPRFVAKET